MPIIPPILNCPLDTVGFQAHRSEERHPLGIGAIYPGLPLLSWSQGTRGTGTRQCSRDKAVSNAAGRDLGQDAGTVWKDMQRFDVKLVMDVDNTGVVEE